MEIWAWALLAFAALIAGLGKTALPGSSTIAVVILASVLVSTDGIVRRTSASSC